MNIKITPRDFLANATMSDIEELRKLMRSTVLPWATDGSSPPRYMRRTVADTPATPHTRHVALVDPWVGGFESSCHRPDHIGVSVVTENRGSCGATTTILRREPDEDYAAFIERAKAYADDLLNGSVGWRFLKEEVG